MIYKKIYKFLIIILITFFIIITSGCVYQKVNIQDLVNQPIEEMGNYNQSKKYIKAGIKVLYLTGSPYEIGFAHGKLCKNEIKNVNKIYWDYYDYHNKQPDDKWLPLSRNIESFIPQEYILEMKGIADGSGIEYDKILFLNTLTTISMADGCFAFAFKDNESKIITLRQIDIATNSPYSKKMILYIIKPQQGYGFAALLNPGMVSGETGLNEYGITVSENNIQIKQTEWDIMPINHLSRYLLQYSGSIDDVEKSLKKQEAYPARLLFVSSKNSASIFEFANKEIATINMKNGYLAMANQACIIPSKNITSPSTKRLDFGNQFLKDNLEDMNIEKAIKLVRTSRISWRWNPIVHNRQSIIFSPAILDFWVAIPPKSDFIPASYGPYVGFNLRQELYGTGHEPSPKSFPAY
jgi:isopenicillin-N N-acyltransferase-like protein